MHQRFFWNSTYSIDHSSHQTKKIEKSLLWLKGRNVQRVGYLSKVYICRFGIFILESYLPSYKLLHKGMDTFAVQLQDYQLALHSKFLLSLLSYVFRPRTTTLRRHKRVECHSVSRADKLPKIFKMGFSSRKWCALFKEQ